MKRIIIANSKKWFKPLAYMPFTSQVEITYIDNREGLNERLLQRISPDYIFFPHWSWIVPESIVDNYLCVGFHTSPLPFGRGGSPIQNLILRGFKSSEVHAIKMTRIMDGGPIFSSRRISLRGNASAIFKRIERSVWELIVEVCEESPVPVPQVGLVTVFKRLTATDNIIKKNMSLEEIYHRIRMVDSDDYSKAYLEFGNKKLEFSMARFKNGTLTANVKIIGNQDSKGM